MHDLGDENRVVAEDPNKPVHIEFCKGMISAAVKPLIAALPRQYPGVANPDVVQEALRQVVEELGILAPAPDPKPKRFVDRITPPNIDIAVGG